MAIFGALGAAAGGDPHGGTTAIIKRCVSIVAVAEWRSCSRSAGLARSLMMRTKAALLAFAGTFALMLPLTADARTVSIPFNPANFSHPLTINNPLLPLVPGTIMIYRSETPDGCEQNRVEVTSSKKKIAAGVTARPVHDQVFAGATCTGPLTLIEDTFDWYAQDNDGNVWYLGEDSKDCDANGCTQNQGSWEAGADVAGSGTLGVAGIIMLAHPRKGDEYQQEYYKDHAEDIAAVQAVDIDVILTRPDAHPPGIFHHCLNTKERSTLEAGSVAQKYYCPTIGQVAEEDLSHGSVRSEWIDPSATAFQFRTVPKRR
jgi:hypothetical protein